MKIGYQGTVGSNSEAAVLEYVKNNFTEKCCINQATLDCENYDNCEECGRISDGDGIQQILQKISECEGNDE